MSLESVVAVLTSSNLSTKPAALGACELVLDSFLRKCLSYSGAIREQASSSYCIEVELPKDEDCRSLS
jgi:hypothetical protein